MSDTVRLLLDRSKIDVNHINNLGWTALLEAVILSDGGPRHIEIVRLLLAAGADPNIADNDGVTPAEARPRPPLRRDRGTDRGRGREVGRHLAAISLIVMPRPALDPELLAAIRSTGRHSRMVVPA